MAGSDLVSTRAQFIVPNQIFEVMPKPFEDPLARRAFRVLRMVSILHGKGFQGLRIMPYMYPIAYRIEVFPARFADTSGVRIRNDSGLRMATEPDRYALHVGYSSGSGSNYFGQKDAAKLNAHELALKFISWFPSLARETYVLDYAYAGWFSSLLAHCEYGSIPYLFGEFEPTHDAMRMQAFGDHPIDWFPLPPMPSAGSTLAPTPRPRWMNDE